MVSKSKTKGSSWERDVCKILSESIGGNFERSNGSGAFVGASNYYRANRMSGNQLKSFIGDIYVPDEYEVIIECKNYKEIDFNNIIKGHCKTLNGWIDQNEHDVKTYGKDIPHVIFLKITRKGEFICLPYDKKFTNDDLTFVDYRYNDKRYMICDMKKFIEINRLKYKRSISIKK